MPTTFKTDKATGKTVISSDNQVQSAAQGGDNQFEYRQDAANLGLRPGRERMLNVISSQQPVQPGYMNFNEFKAVRGMTDTNPYGNDGFFTRVLGIDPSKIDYSNNLSQQGIANVSRVAYDRFLNPFAKVSSVTGRPVGGDAATGTPRYGISPGEQTIAGIAREVPRTGLDALVSGIPFIGGIARMFGNRPTRITSMEDYEQQQQALGMGADLYRKPTQFDNLTPEPIPVGKEVASELPTPITFLPDELSGESPFTSGGVPEPQGVYSSDRRDIDPPSRFEFGPDGVPKTRFEDITVDGKPLNQTSAVEQSEPLSDLGMIQAMNRQVGSAVETAEDMNRRLQFQQDLIDEARRASGITPDPVISSVPSVSQVISGAPQNQFPNLPNYVPASGGLPFDLIGRLK